MALDTWLQWSRALQWSPGRGRRLRRGFARGWARPSPEDQEQVRVVLVAVLLAPMGFPRRTRKILGETPRLGTQWSHVNRWAPLLRGWSCRLPRWSTLRLRWSRGGLLGCALCRAARAPLSQMCAGRLARAARLPRQLACVIAIGMSRQVSHDALGGVVHDSTPCVSGLGGGVVPCVAGDAGGVMGGST